MKTSVYLTQNLSAHRLPSVSLSGHVSVPAPNCHFKRICDEWILYCIIEGSMKLQEDDVIYSLSAGDTILLSPKHCHSGITVHNSIQYYYVHFSWDGLEECLLTDEIYAAKKIEEHGYKLSTFPENGDPAKLLLPKKTSLLPGAFSEIIDAIQKLLSENEAILFHQSNIKDALLYIILMLISRSETERITTQISTASFIPALLTYFHNHLGEKISGAVLEREFHHNFDYMNRKFHESTGKSIFQYLQEYRIQESKKLLQTNHINISQIAENLGYCNAFYFSKVFKTIEGITPSEYRKQYRDKSYLQ